MKPPSKPVTEELPQRVSYAGTEQPIPRPKDRTKRKTHYSGKKKRHTVKN